METKLEIRNRKSLRQLMSENDAPFNQFASKKEGKTFFTCGNIIGYVSPRAAELLADETSTVDDFQYFEFKAPNNDTFIPCIAVVSNQQALRTFTL